MKVIRYTFIKSAVLCGILAFAGAFLTVNHAAKSITHFFFAASLASMGIAIISAVILLKNKQFDRNRS